MSIIYVSKNIPDYDQFMKCIKVDIMKELVYLDNIKRIGLVWENDNNIIPEEFINLLSLYKEPIIVDLITCSLVDPNLNFPNITINYSTKPIGKGNWDLSGENIKDIYFNDNIDNYNYTLGLPSDGALGSNFSYSDVANVRTFTLTTDFTIDNTNTWTQVNINYSDNTHQVIIDGNNKKITIDEDNFGGLFLAGNYFVGNNKPTIIRNLFIKATTNIDVAIAVVNGYVSFENCHLELFGNINNNGGGFCYNNGANDMMKLYLSDCSAKVFGKIGNNAGPLIGYIALNSGSIYNITNCSSVVSDSDSLSTNTLGSSAGAFVGSGISNNVTINNSYCLFNGSMGTGSGILAGKFLGSSDTLTISKLYTVSNITYAIDGSDAGQAGNYSYNLSSYFGGSKPTTFTISNYNILNLGTNLTNIYAEVGTLYNTLTNTNKFTDYTTFATTANTAGARIGTDTFIITFDVARTFYTFTTNYDNDWNWDLTDDILKGVSILSSFSISNMTIGDPPFTPTLPTIIVGDGVVSYSSSDITKATVNMSSGLITLLATGSVTITATISGTDYYILSTSDASFTINDLPCLTEDTMVLTPNGYINICKLNEGDNILTNDNRIVKIIKIYKSIVKGNDRSYPCIIPKNIIAMNYPKHTFRISQGHLIKYKDYWIHPRVYFKVDRLENITYYHIKLENYITDHLVINDGVVVESLGNYPSEKPNNDYIKENRMRRRQIYNKLTPL